MSVQVILPAAGMGTRLGKSVPKALVSVGGLTLLEHTLRRFDRVELLSKLLIVIPPAHREAFQAVLDKQPRYRSVQCIDGGAERQESVQRALACLEENTELVVIHDAARPFVPPTAITASIEAARNVGAATVAIPSIDTMLEVDEERMLVATPDRKRLWACQTPQTFRVEVILKAHEAARSEGFLGTDDASLVRRLGAPVKIVPGSPVNLKITTPIDLRLAELICQDSSL